jgi:hypothetical protein
MMHRCMHMHMQKMHMHMHDHDVCQKDLPHSISPVKKAPMRID